MIIPRSPSPIRLEDRPIDELTLEESRELLRRQRVSAQSPLLTDLQSLILYVGTG
jgi:hypothetical protein